MILELSAEERVLLIAALMYITSLIDTSIPAEDMEKLRKLQGRVENNGVR